MRKEVKQFRMRMFQDRVDLFNELWDLPEFKNINTQTKLVENVFRRYQRLRKAMEETNKRIESLKPSIKE